jgi:hypothetical protein
MLLPCSPPDVCAAFLAGQESERSKRNRMRATHRDQARKLAVVLVERAPSIPIPVSVGASDEIPLRTTNGCGPPRRTKMSWTAPTAWRRLVTPARR